MFGIPHIKQLIWWFITRLLCEYFKNNNEIIIIDPTGYPKNRNNGY